MERDSQHIVELIGKFNAGKATADEIRELETWYASFDDADAFTRDLDVEERDRLKRNHFARILRRLNTEQHGPHLRTHRFRPRKIFAGLAVVLAVLTGAYFMWPPTSLTDTPQQVVDAMPGGNKATLTLADGTQVNLDSIDSGYIANEDGIRITKLADGQVQYEIPGHTDAAEASPSPGEAYNTITTPAGGQYVVVLPDGTKAWMNASSSLRYPTRFSDDVRTVELEGEAYFEVTSKFHRRTVEKIPFVVKTSGYDVKVLGTEFNVNAYADEGSVRTTLVSGRVDIVMPETEQAAASQIALYPNQQASLRNGKIDVDDVDVNTAIAWKDGFFYFNNTDLYGLVRQFARWYNVDVQYAPGVKNDVFFGKIPRNYTLSEAMTVLDLGNVHFRIHHHHSKSERGRKQLILGP